MEEYVPMEDQQLISQEKNSTLDNIHSHSPTNAFSNQSIQENEILT